MDFVLGRRSEYNLSCQTHFYAQTSVSIVQLMYFWKAKGPKYVAFAFLCHPLPWLAQNSMLNGPVFLFSKNDELMRWVK